MLTRCFLAIFASRVTAQTLPPVSWTVEDSHGNDASSLLSALPKNIYIESDFATRRDTDGLTLIPPSANDFAKIFQDDLNTLYRDGSWTLDTVDEIPDEGEGIFLGTYTGSTDNMTYESGQQTSEGYMLSISNGRVVIRGAGARGMWWGTRTVLQQLIDGHPFSAGETTDVPAYATRGYMLDAGRKWYTPSMLKELCTYASFFKMNEFHYHASDNYPLSRGRNETWNEVYSHFSFMPESDELKPIIERENETLSRADFEDLQLHCAQRGITVIPEIEAPGHCLAITKWKPELALPKKDLLNLTHPDAIPTVQSIWAEFLPWFQTKEVHIGADEYDSTLADDYIRFVNEMSTFVNTTSGKRIRIWGTHEPSENLTISKDIVIQHWQYGQSDPVQLDRDGYNIINSEDWWAYVTLKNDHTPILPAPYPQFFNTTRTLNFAGQEGWQWEPSMYNPVNVSEQLSTSSRMNRGAIMAAWNDNGPDATTQLEAYYAIRDGIPIVASRAWTGSRGPALDPSTADTAAQLYSRNIPNQNLDRRLAAEIAPTGPLALIRDDCTKPLLEWTRPENAPLRTDLGLGSKGMNYTLTLHVDGAFNLTSADTTLRLDTDGKLSFFADGYEYPLRSTSISDGYDPGHPGRIFTNLTSSTHEVVRIRTPAQIQVRTDVIGGSRVWANGRFVGRFEVFVYGGRNTLFSWSQMAFVAPLGVVEGSVRGMTLVGCVGDEGLVVEPEWPAPFEGGGARGRVLAGGVFWMVVLGAMVGYMLDF